MNISFFKKKVEPFLKGYKCKYISFPGYGDFGKLKRVEFEGYNKAGNVDFWSTGWLDIDVVDYYLDQHIVNLLYGPDEIDLQKRALENLLKVLINNEQNSTITG